MRRGSVMRERGQVLPFVIVFMLALLVMLGLVIDVAQAYRARVALRASTDAAALAGAANLPNTASASSTAYAYGGSGKNPVPNVGAVSTNVQTTCTSKLPGLPPREHRVRDAVGGRQDDVPAAARLRQDPRPGDGIRVLALRRPAAGRDGRARPHRIDVPVLGRPQDPSCTDLNNAKDGIRTFLQLMDPAGTKIGLAVLPPATSIGAAAAAPASGNYNAPGNPYVVVPLVNDYRSAGRRAQPELPAGVDGELHPRRRQHGLRERHRGGPGRARPLRPARGSGHHRDAVRRRGQHRADLLPNNSLYRTQPCNQGVRSAAAIKAKKTMVYTIGYDLDATAPGTNVCKNGVNQRSGVPVDHRLQRAAADGEPRATSTTTRRRPTCRRSSRRSPSTSTRASPGSSTSTAGHRPEIDPRTRERPVLRWRTGRSCVTPMSIELDEFCARDPRSCPFRMGPYPSRPSVLRTLSKPQESEGAIIDLQRNCKVDKLL